MSQKTTMPFNCSRHVSRVRWNEDITFNRYNVIKCSHLRCMIGEWFKLLNRSQFFLQNITGYEYILTPRLSLFLNIQNIKQYYDNLFTKFYRVSEYLYLLVNVMYIFIHMHTWEPDIGWERKETAKHCNHYPNSNKKGIKWSRSLDQC